MKSRALRYPWLLSVLILASVMAGPAVAEPPREDTAAASPRLQYLPKDYWLVAELDAGTVMKFVALAGAQANNPQVAQLLQYLEMAKTFTGIDLEKELDWITVFAAGNVGDDAKFLAVAQGSFDNDKVVKQLKKSLNDSTEKTYKKHTIYSTPKADLCFPKASTILIGDAGLVRGAIDKLDDEKDTVPKSLKSVLAHTPGKAFVWAAVQPQVLLEQKELADWRKDNAELYGALKKIECISISFDMAQDGLLIKGLGYAAPDQAKSVYEYLSNRKKTILHEEGTNILFVSLLILSEIKMNDTFIEGSFRLTGEALQQLWGTKLIVKPKAGGSK
ncbi:MAG TPA: hypothetical protein VGZ47_20080 [Gemmataceae bacterium]|jgi:hypothetical protein|nr:hypothetical protein [Gemmataceae bacterium]